ncbi:hypothetical protein FD755_009752 [Muntiacus reevesi]|uniref:Dymeclin n=1 Tax=Muntiacus reevesi TaxID=9886 RepID=A0A5N3XWF1_MUNRE|nr:hypothetical protein FD755_009752 [Muntiacus reevesi]
MGSNSSRIGDLPKNEYLKKLSGTESVSENDPFWNQLLSFSFPAPTSRQEYWSGLPVPSPRDLPDPGIKPVSPSLQADSLPLNPWGSTKSIHRLYEVSFLLVNI